MQAQRTWERTEDGKYWKYVYAPDRQAIDEWIEIDGKEYYFDKKRPYEDRMGYK